MVLSSKALKEFKTDVKAFAEPIWKSWKFQPKPKYFEQIYLDLKSYHEKLSGKLPTNSKASTLGPWRALKLKSRPRARGPAADPMSECRKLANKWPGHFSIKSRILSYRSRLLAWAFWAQIRAQEQKIRSKSELRLSLELIFKIAIKWGNPTKWFQQIKTSFKLFMTKVSPMNYYKLRKPQRVYLTWALSFLLSFVN